MQYSPFKYSPSVYLVPTFLLLFLWAVFLINMFFNLHLNNHGIVPRTFFGLQGIFFSIFLHDNYSHIAHNSMPLFLLTMALIYFYRNLSLKVLLYGILLSGFITWLIGNSGTHIGASSIIYVMVSFLFFKGFLTNYYRLMALSFTLVLVYGGMLWYVFPLPQVAGIAQNISWEGHLAGFIVGFIFAYYFKTPNYQAAVMYDWQQPNFNANDDNFMQHFDENGNFVTIPSHDIIDE